MGEHIADRVVKLMARSGIEVVGGRVLVLGLAFKENCPDIRNTRVVDIVAAFQAYHLKVDVYDPWVSPDQAEEEFGIRPIETPEKSAYDAIVLAVAHDCFRETAESIRSLARESHVLFDVKHGLPQGLPTARL